MQKQEQKEEEEKIDQEAQRQKWAEEKANWRKHKHERDCAANKHYPERYDIRKDKDGYILGWKTRCRYCKADLGSDVSV